ncbi:MAG TPA: sigma-54 dependent transcriptional regulator [Polyangiaceae bacterium]|nr:sigma-54 dependent transcriptional regulator [Polyangiaceae bacterium]
MESRLEDGSDAWPFANAARERGIPVVFVARSSVEALAISALRAGVVDYFRPPIVCSEVCRRLSSLVRKRPSSAPPLPRATCLQAQIARAAGAPSCVLITGETGTGKEVAAKGIHTRSPRAHGPFVSVNCAAIPDTLVESELFGFERGSFTGAATAMDGKWQLANRGTLFLDEIGDMSLLAQAKILRALESREVARLGARRPTPVDVRIVAATNQDPQALVEAGKFRRDLFYRLNVIRIHLPPLRERPDEIPGLVHQLVGEMNSRFDANVVGLDDPALAVLASHSWPGNIRELRNLIESVFVDLPSGFHGMAGLSQHIAARVQRTELGPSERARLLAALQETRWNVTHTAERLQWSRMTVYRKMTKYQMTRT